MEDLKLYDYLKASSTNCLYCLFNEHGAYDDDHTSDCHYLEEMIKRSEQRNCPFYINGEKYLLKNKEAILKEKALYE
jgi:hypothetical protein